jgi:hypothetical protein
MVLFPRGKKTRFTPYNQGVKLLIIQGVSAKIFEPNNSVIFQRIFVKFKMQII